MQNTPDITQIFCDAFRQAAPALRVLVPIALTITSLQLCVTVAKVLCQGYRSGRPRAEKSAVSVNLATVEKMKKQRKEAEKVRICDGCASCPICKDTGLTEERCPLFSTASCCIGMKIDERGRLL